MPQTPPDPSRPTPGPAAARRLSRLLARWADARRLTVPRAEAIRQAIMAPPDTARPEPLEFEWWWRLFDPVAGVASGRTLAGPVPSAFDAGVTLPVTPWPIDPSALPEPADLGAWHRDVADYQPYLRLT